MYRKGLGVEKSYVEAARLYKAAGESKHKKAQANLDHLLQKGYVTEEDLVVPDVDEESKPYAYIYLAVMALLLLVIPSRILKRYRDAVAALEALEKEESPPPPRARQPAAQPVVQPASGQIARAEARHLERR